MSSKYWIFLLLAALQVNHACRGRDTTPRLPQGNSNPGQTPGGNPTGSDPQVPGSEDGVWTPAERIGDHYGSYLSCAGLGGGTGSAVYLWSLSQDAPTMFARFFDGKSWSAPSQQAKEFQSCHRARVQQLPGNQFKLYYLLAKAPGTTSSTPNNGSMTLFSRDWAYPQTWTEEETLFTANFPETGLAYRDFQLASNSSGKTLITYFNGTGIVGVHSDLITGGRTSQLGGNAQSEHGAVLMDDDNAYALAAESGLDQGKLELSSFTPPTSTSGYPYWSPEAETPDTFKKAGYIRMTVDKQNNVHGLWVSQAQGQEFWELHAGTWSPVTKQWQFKQLDDKTVVNITRSVHQLQVLNDGRLMATWIKGGTAARKLMASFYNSTLGWSEPMQVDVSVPGSVDEPQSISFPDGRIVTVYTKFDGKLWNLWWSWFDGTSWRLGGQVENVDEGHSNRHEMILLDNTRALLVWRVIADDAKQGKIFSSVFQFR